MLFVSKCERYGKYFNQAVCTSLQYFQERLGEELKKCCPSTFGKLGGLVQETIEDLVANVQVSHLSY